MRALKISLTTIVAVISFLTIAGLCGLGQPDTRKITLADVGPLIELSFSISPNSDGGCDTTIYAKAVLFASIDLLVGRYEIDNGGPTEHLAPFIIERVAQGKTGQFTTAVHAVCDQKTVYRFRGVDRCVLSGTEISLSECFQAIRYAKA